MIVWENKNGVHFSAIVDNTALVQWIRSHSLIDRAKKSEIVRHERRLSRHEWNEANYQESWDLIIEMLLLLSLL